MRKVVIEMTDELHKELKIDATKKGKSIKDYVTGLIIEEIEKEQTQ